MLTRARNAQLNICRVIPIWTRLGFTSRHGSRPFAPTRALRGVDTSSRHSAPKEPTQNPQPTTGFNESCNRADPRAAEPLDLEQQSSESTNVLYGRLAISRKHAAADRL